MVESNLLRIVKHRRPHVLSSFLVARSDESWKPAPNGATMLVMLASVIELMESPLSLVSVLASVPLVSVSLPASVPSARSPALPVTLMSSVGVALPSETSLVFTDRIERTVDSTTGSQ